MEDLECSVVAGPHFWMKYHEEVMYNPRAPDASMFDANTPSGKVERFYYCVYCRKHDSVLEEGFVGHLR